MENDQAGGRAGDREEGGVGLRRLWAESAVCLGRSRDKQICSGRTFTSSSRDLFANSTFVS